MTMTPCLDCGEPAHGSRCPDHQGDRERVREAHRDRHAIRANPARWKNLSARVRRMQPWCTACAATTDLSADHVIPITDRPDLAYRQENLTVLCRTCNGRKAGRAPTDAERQDVLSRLPARLAAPRALGRDPSPTAAPPPPQVKFASHTSAAGTPSVSSSR